MRLINMRLIQNRYLVFGAVVLFVFLLVSTLEPRRRSYSCKTLSSCLWSPQHRYAHATTPVEPVLYYRSRVLSDGVEFFERKMADIEPEILILVLNKDQSSWSKDFRSTDRSIYDFLDLLVSTGLDFTNVTLGFMTTSQDEFAEMKVASSELPFARTVLVYQQDDGPKFSYQERHSPIVQRERRAWIAALRNYLTLRTLDDEEHIFWMDADVVEFSDGILQTMLSHTAARDDVGILTTRCQQHLIESYDKNAWVIDKERAHLLGPVDDEARQDVLSELVGSRRYADEIIKGTSDADLIPLDSTGGTLLYIRSDLVRRGLVFPTYNVVGSTWSQDGWIGIETEGLCYAASHMKGGGCFVLGGDHHIRHADWG
ncbi:hypothetical protein G7054_g14926 [Neopestalotiopsis clavispora]|nr:hypothetical protein G7054_g14926 [Neopestalotiopsis clavispora]